MKKHLFVPVLILLTAAVLFSPLPAARKASGRNTAYPAATGELGIEAPNSAARCMAVMDAESGRLLFSRNADERRGMASTTKIMTALVILENLDPDSEHEIPECAVGVEGSSVYLRAGERLTVRELLYCLMLESGNDAAAALACICAGSTEAFAEMMNGRAAEMGLADTHFANPHGLSDESHYTTARELALITSEAMQYPLFCEIVGTVKARVRYDGVEGGRYLYNHNRLLTRFGGCTGVKTGFTRADGRCLVSAAERGGVKLIAVTLNDPFPAATHAALLEYAFQKTESVLIAEPGGISTVVAVDGSETLFVAARNTSEVRICLPAGAAYSVEIEASTVEAPVEKGEIIAHAAVMCGGSAVDIIPLEAAEPVKAKRRSIFEILFGE